MELRGERHRLFQPFTDKQGVTKPNLSWAAYSNDMFCEGFDVGDGEWAAGLAAWPASVRARWYGLGEKEEKKGFSVDYELVGERALEKSAKRRGGKRRGSSRKKA